MLKTLKSCFLFKVSEFYVANLNLLILRIKGAHKRNAFGGVVKMFLLERG